MTLRLEEVERALLNCMSSNRQIPVCIVPFQPAAIINIFHARKKIGTCCVHRQVHFGSSITTLLFFQGLCEASFIQHEQAVHVKRRRHFLGALLVRVGRLKSCRYLGISNKVASLFSMLFL